MPKSSSPNSEISTMLMTRHPCYNMDEYRRYRLTYERGEEFIETYLKKHYEEDPAAYRDRKAITYNPTFAAEAVDEYVRAIVQRSPDIYRVGGSDLYRKICEGEENGVDRQGSTMNAFMSKYVVPELLAMGKVGVYIDNDANLGMTLADQRGRHPYIYVYRAENILNWRHDPQNPNRLMAVLLRDYIEDLDSFGLPQGFKARYRIVQRSGTPKDPTIVVRVFEEDGKEVSTTTQRTEFPFVIGNLSHSLLKVTSWIQITLLNLCSSDTYYAWASNFPLYVEQYDPLDWDRLKERRTTTEDMPHPPPVEPDMLNNGEATSDSFSSMPPGPATDEQPKIKVGTMHGRLYPLNADRPGFVHPSPEPLKASMEKEEQLKHEIRQLTALAITQLQPQKQASAESKQQDNLGLEAGMAFIAQELQGIENRISAVFHSYDKRRPQPTKIKYPEKYNLKSDEDRREEAKQLKELHQAVPSRKFTIEVSKIIATTLFKDKVTSTELALMHKEIEDSPVPTADPDILRSDHEAGLVSDKTTSIGRGYKPDEHIQAQKDHAARAARILDAQTSPESRGVGDLGNDPDAPKDEKTKTQDGNLDKRGRGPEKIKPKGEN